VDRKCADMKLPILHVWSYIADAKKTEFNKSYNRDSISQITGIQ